MMRYAVLVKGDVREFETLEEAEAYVLTLPEDVKWYIAEKL